MNTLQLKSKKWSISGLVAFVAVCMIWPACVPPEDPEPQTIDYTLEDPICREILDFQDKQQADSLFPYLRHDDPTYRWLAARAFASFRTTKAVDSLLPLLSDSWTEIRRQAAFALGQIADSTAEQPLIQAFEQNDTLGQYTESNAAILEAIGKCGGKESLHHLVRIETYLPSDTLLLLGQARGMYRYMLRDMIDSAGTVQMVRWLTQPLYPESVRLIAADYLKRAQNLNLGQHQYAIRRAYTREDEEPLRSYLAFILGKTGRNSVVNLFEQSWNDDASVNERCNILSTCTKHLSYEAGRTLARSALRDENYSVQTLAAEFFLKNGSEDDASEYREWAMDESLTMPVRLTLYRASLRHLPFYYSLTKASIRGALRRVLNTSDNPYHIAAALMGLSEEWDYRRDILKYANPESAPLVRTTAVRAYGSLNSPDRQLSSAQKRRWFREMQELLLIEDPGMTYAAVQAILESGDELSTTPLEPEQIKKRREKCPLPSSVETYNALGRLLADLEQETFDRVSPEFSHPIDWETVRACTDSSIARLYIGEEYCDIRLLVDEAPGTVANFVQLVRDGFYRDKSIHRVVPNFVLQDGCPRGDGFGSLDYTIRSETPPIYYDRPGRVGMASAGPHTECTQWFITHRPTPHLDGRYTIFGQLRSGQEMVEAIARGDTVRRIELINMQKTEQK